MKKSKVLGLLKYRMYNLPVETLWGYAVIICMGLIAAFLGLPVVAAGLFMWLFPSWITFNGMEEAERKTTKLQLAMPISRKQNIDIRFISFIVVNVITVTIGFLFYSLTDFFVSLNLGVVIDLDLGGLNWLFSQVSFFAIAGIMVGFTFYNAALYYALSYTIFKNQGKPPFWVTIIITGAFMMADSYMHWFNLTWEMMPTVMLVVGLVLFIISYFVSVRAFRKLDFS